MKNIKILFTAAVITLFLCGASFAAENAGEKLSRGVTNVVTAPVEIAKQIDTQLKKDEQQQKNKAVSVASGFLKGVAFTFARFGSGLWDIVSFPFHYPSNYEPLLKPEYVLDKDEPEQKTEDKNK